MLPANTVILSNVPRDDMPARGTPRGPHVYPFYDKALYDEYYRWLSPPGDESLFRPGVDPLAGSALAHCWTSTSSHQIMAPGFNPVFWPFHNTQIVDAAAAADTVPTDGGRLDPEDLSHQVVEALADQDGIRRYHAPDTVLRPQPGTIRTRKFRLKIPVKLREVLREWRSCVNVTYNEAIRIVNAVTCHADLPDEKDLIAQLCNAHSAFVKKRPYLKSCPVATRRAAVAQAISNRQGLLTRHYNTAAAARPAEPTLLSPASADKDRKRGFTLTVDNEAGRIKFDENESGIHGLQLQLCPKTARHAMGSSYRKEDIHAQIRLRGQVQRRFLVNHCVAHGKNRNLFSPAHEFKIQFDRYGHWNFLFPFDVADPGPAPTQLSGPIVVTTDDPGVCNPHAIYQSNGTVIDIGNAQDGQRLEQLRLREDRIKRRRDRKRPVRPLPGPRRNAHRRPPPPVAARPPRPPPPPLPPPPPPVARAPPRPGRRSRSVPFALSAKHRRRLDRQARAIRYKLSNLVTDLHCRLAHHMALASGVIVMPRMEVRNMIRRRGARLHRSTKRRLMPCGHCAFLNRLSIKCRDIGADQRYESKRQTVLLVQPEPYTSKTCGQCGKLNDRLGSSRTFACSDPECQYVADRDHNGAYNMAIRAIRSAN